jgi:hypothetical protein
MKIKLQEITIRALTEGYLNNEEDGVVGFDGKLDIRPKYQREFVYKDAQRNAVIETVRKDFPLNVMYWVKNGDAYEVLDGQQRTISICSYVDGDFSIEDKDGNIQYFHNLLEDQKNKILDYKLMVYFCEGTDSEKLDWFRTINIAGEKLTEQELRNAVYTGAWLTDAKRYFSRSNCGAYNLASDYMNGTPIRQDYLETVISWISEDNIEQYMADHQADPNASKLWLYFQSVINWVQTTFPEYRREMKGLDWGALYNQYKDKALDATTLEATIGRLMQDEDITNKKGIYIYVLSGQERHLNIRAFTPNQKREAYEHQKGICTCCGKKFELPEMEADHITPWSKGGKTSADNCQMLCKEDNRRKSGK